MVMSLVKSLIFSMIITSLGWMLEQTALEEMLNNFFGYRTKLAKKNADTWVEANKYSGRLLKMSGLSLAFISIITFLTFQDSGHLISLSIGFVLILWVYLRTEQHLKRLFDQDGNRLINS